MAYIARKDWLAYVRKLAALNERAAADMRAYVQKHGFGDERALIAHAYALATKYGEGAAALAAAMYDTLAALEGAFVPAAEVAETADYTTVAKTVQGVVEMSRNENLLGGAVGRLVKRAGADTTLQNALRDGAEFAWVPVGDNCPFCITLASRGWQRISKKTLRNGHAEHIHANCDCSYVVRHRSDLTVRGYEPERYLAAYEGAAGATPGAKINAMRRAQYAEKRDEINAQKRAAYAKRVAAQIGEDAP